jgi:hypothetical protein
MTEIVAAARLLLTWVAFRYERHRRWRDAVDAAYGTLSAIQHGMVKGLEGVALGWVSLTFNGTSTVEARSRGREKHEML